MNLYHMNRFTLYLMVALLTFVLGIGAVSLWARVRYSSPVTIKRTENLSSKSAPTLSGRGYKVVSSGKVLTKDGTPTFISSWRTSDGMSFYHWREYHVSPEHAHRSLQKTLDKAVKIIKRETLFDVSGHEVGEKVIATFPPQYSEYGTVALLWTDGATFTYESSSSLQNILEFEKDIHL